MARLCGTWATFEYRSAEDLVQSGTHKRTLIYVGSALSGEHISVTLQLPLDEIADLGYRVAKPKLARTALKSQESSESFTQVVWCSGFNKVFEGNRRDPTVFQSTLRTYRKRTS
jgi:hypothetical protein